MVGLEGLEVVVTRPLPEGERLAQAIAKAGGRALLAPLLTIEPLKASPPPRAEIWIYVSRNAVRACPFRPPPEARCFAIGPGTAEALEGVGLRVDGTPPPPYTSEALLTLPALKEVAGKGILLVCGEGGRRLLEEELRRRGAEPFRLEVYRRAPPPREVVEQLRSWLREGEKVVVATSGEILERLRRSVPEAVRHPVCVPGPRLQEEARRLGFSEVIPSASPRDTDLIAALAAWKKS